MCVWVCSIPVKMARPTSHQGLPVYLQIRQFLLGKNPSDSAGGSSLNQRNIHEIPTKSG